jgi:hypothetical protein
VSSVHRQGEARFEFTPPGGSTLTSPFLLAVPLSPLPEFETSGGRERFAWRSADRSVRETVVVSSGKSDLFASIRFDDQPARLRAMLRHSMDDGMVLNYKLTAAGTAHPMVVEEVLGGDLRVRPDRERGAFGEWEAAVHFVLDTTVLEALL